MEYAKQNKGVIVFYLLLIVTTLVVINFNGRNLSLENNVVYLSR